MKNEQFYPNMEVNMIIEPLREGIFMPEYNDAEGDALDVFVNLPDPKGTIRISPGATVVVPTGFKLGIPKGWMVDVRPRSGVSLKTKLRVANAPGTIDTNYKNEIGIVITNTSIGDGPHRVFDISSNCISAANSHSFNTAPAVNGDGTYILKNGDKIAQILPTPRFTFKFEIGKATDIGTDRGGGLGSSGTRSKTEETE